MLLFPSLSSNFILQNGLLLLSHFSLGLTLCDPIGSSPPGSPVPGTLQARTLEWVAISFFSAWKWKVKVKSLSCVGLLATPWTAAYRLLHPWDFSRQEYWSGVPLPSPKCVVKATYFPNVLLWYKKFRMEAFEHWYFSSPGKLQGSLKTRLSLDTLTAQTL